VSTGGILALGAVAGLTIFIGLPVGRMRGLPTSVRTLLNAVAVGVLIFLVWDVLSGAVGPIESRLEALTGDHPHGSWAGFAGHAALLAVGLGVGLLSLVYYDRLLPRRRSVGGSSVGPGAASVQEFTPTRTLQSPAARLALMIAIGIGLHNFA
jgi:zinc transporter, ZIP family